MPTQPLASQVASAKKVVAYCVEHLVDVRRHKQRARERPPFSILPPSKQETPISAKPTAARETKRASHAPRPRASQPERRVSENALLFRGARPEDSHAYACTHINKAQTGRYQGTTTRDMPGRGLL